MHKKNEVRAQYSCSFLKSCNLVVPESHDLGPFACAHGGLGDCDGSDSDFFLALTAEFHVLRASANITFGKHDLKSWGFIM